MAVDADEGRRRREDIMVEIRKTKREENLTKKRREGLQSAVNLPQLDNKVILLDDCFFCFSYHFTLDLIELDYFLIVIVIH